LGLCPRLSLLYDPEERGDDKVFVRETVVPVGDKRHTYVQIVESQRVGGKVKQRLVCSLGNRDNLDPAAVDRLVMALAKYGTCVPVPRPSVTSNLGDADLGVGSRGDRHFGDVFVLDQVWRDLGLRSLLKRFADHRRFKFDVERAAFAMVASRLIQPKSKLATETWLDQHVHFPHSTLFTHEQFYSALLWLNEVKGELEVDLHRLLKRRRLTGARVYFYDTTLTHFDGEGPESLAQVTGRRGARGTKRHVLVGVVTTSDGWPVMTHVFPGATNDAKTFQATLRELYDRFGLREIVIICDRGMRSKEVIKLLEAKDGYDYGYIVATKLRRQEVITNNVLKRAGRYHRVEDGLDVKEVWVEKQRYVVCRNQDSAARDGNRRAEIVAQLEEKIGAGLDPATKAAMKLRTKAYDRYLKICDGRLVIDREAVEKDTRYDGKWVLQSNLPELDPGKIALRYKDEARIERSMRTLKSFLRLRPVFHHGEEWVNGHVFVCTLALLLYRALQERLGSWPASPESVEQVLALLGTIRATENRVGHENGEPQYVWTRSDYTPPQQDLLRRLGMKKLPHLLGLPPRLSESARARTQERRERRRKPPRAAASPDVML
jgi:transposase